MGSSGKSLIRTRQELPLKIDARPRIDFQDTIPFRTNTASILGRSSGGVYYLYATAALAGPLSGITSVAKKTNLPTPAAEVAPVKSKASPNSISMLSDISSPKTFSRARRR